MPNEVDREYVFFYGGPFSQWYSCEFTDNQKTYFCAEQYMMYQKAILFDDVNIAKKIITSDNPREQKAYGRKISGFDQIIWDKNKYNIVLQGNRYKFTQNKHLLDNLKSTCGKILVEASPYDKIWGIGRGTNDPLRLDPKTWNGQNLLGKILTALRVELFSN